MSGVLLLSGGVDSLALLADLCARGERPVCLSVGYGQRHHRELAAAAQFAAHYGVARRFVSLPRNILAGSALTRDRDIPVGCAPDAVEQAATVVPGRNAVIAALACALAVRESLPCVYLACHAGDAAVYPDCRPQFLTALDAAFLVAYGVSVRAPFLTLTKAEIVRVARRHGAPVEAAYSCYAGGPTPCGVCGACLGRKAAGA